MLHRHEISALCSGVSGCTAHPTVSSPLSEQQSTQNHTEKEIRPCLQQLFCWLLCSDEWFILICLIALLPSPFTEKWEQHWSTSPPGVKAMMLVDDVCCYFLGKAIVPFFSLSKTEQSLCLKIDLFAVVLSHLIDFLEVRHDWFCGGESNSMRLAPCLSRKQRQMDFLFSFFFLSSSMHLQPFTSRRKCSMNFMLGLSSHLLMQKEGCKKSFCPVTEQSARRNNCLCLCCCGQIFLTGSTRSPGRLVQHLLTVRKVLVAFNLHISSLSASTWHLF